MDGKARFRRAFLFISEIPLAPVLLPVALPRAVSFHGVLRVAFGSTLTQGRRTQGDAGFPCPYRSRSLPQPLSRAFSFFGYGEGGGRPLPGHAPDRRG